MDNTKKPWLKVLHYLANSLQELGKNKPVPAKSYLQFCEWEITQNESFYNESGKFLLLYVQTARVLLDKDREVALSSIKMAYNLIGEEVFSV